MKRRGKPGHLRVVDTAVVEDKTGAGESHTGLLRLQLQLDNMMVSYKAEPTSGGQGKFKTQARRPLAAMHSGKERLLLWDTARFHRSLNQQGSLPG